MNTFARHCTCVCVLWGLYSLLCYLSEHYFTALIVGGDQWTQPIPVVWVGQFPCVYTVCLYVCLRPLTSPSSLPPSDWYSSFSSWFVHDPSPHISCEQSVSE